MRRHSAAVGLAIGLVAFGSAHARATPGLDAAPAGIESTPGVTGHRPSGNPLWAIPLRSLTATRERPIFLVSRRPPTPAVAAAFVPPPPPLPAPQAGEPDHPLLQLVGTIAGNSAGIGVFLDESTKDVVRLRVGETFGGWTLRSVRRRETVFDKGAQSALLSLPTPEENPSQTPAPQTASIPIQPQGAGTWVDGDGQMISPPPGQKPRR